MLRWFFHASKNVGAVTAEICLNELNALFLFFKPDSFCHVRIQIREIEIFCENSDFVAGKSLR